MASGREHFDLAWRLGVLGWLGCALLQLALYLRPGPYGGPFLLEWQRYFGLSLYFDVLGVWLIAFPFLLVWLVLWRRPLRPRWALLHQLQLLLIAVNLVLSAFDHEVLRFLGTRLTLSFIAIYARPATLADSLFQDVLIEDRGGALVGLILVVAVPALYVILARRMVRRRQGTGRLRPAWWLALPIAIVPLAAPANGWRLATSEFRLRKTEPVLVALAIDLKLGWRDLTAPPDLEARIAAYQRQWLAESRDAGWRFDDPARPYLRTPAHPSGPTEATRWNVIYIQLESFRGIDMGFHGRPGPSPTPYLDSLAARGDTAVFARTLSFGMPTINGLFATHCSITPHSRRFITSFTPVAMYCLPTALRRRGYRTEMFNAGDTDWDNSTIWLRRWYDRLWRFPEARQEDRPVFRAAARRIKALGRAGRPFMASVVSVSNHTPFVTREPAFDIAGQSTPQERILNTTRYTDDVVREFLESLSGEPWIERTLIVIVGDHAFNLGEHRVPSGQLSLYREAVWVPLIIAGGHGRLTPGRHGELATLLDVAPTVADLLGVREPVPWQGHSLVTGTRPRSLAFAVQDWRLAEGPGWSAVQAPTDERPRLFDPVHDWLERREVTTAPARAAALIERADQMRRLNDYLLRHDRIWREAGS